MRDGSDTVDNAYSGERRIIRKSPQYSHKRVSSVWSHRVTLLLCSVYDTSGSYQNSHPGFGSRPGEDLVAEESRVPTVTITSHPNTARLELVD